MFDPTDCPDYEELIVERRRKSQWLSKFLAHPNPQDPDYPGDCPGTEGNEHETE